MKKRKSIPGHPGFTCDDSGVIYGKRGKPMVGYVDRCGYKEVLFSENGKTKSYLAHRLILSTFLPIENMSDYDINHKNGNKQDNSVDNLEWCTRSENVRHSYNNGLQKQITNKYGTYKVLTAYDLNVIRDLHTRGYIDKDIANELGCSREVVSRKIREMNLR